MDGLIEKLNKLHDEGKHQEIVDEIEKLTRLQLNYDILGRYSRALNNLDRFEEALAVIEIIKKDGEQDFLWHYRKGYSLFYLDRDEEAAASFQKAVELCGNGEENKVVREDAIYLLNEALKFAEHKRKTALYYGDWRGDGEQSNGWSVDSRDNDAWTF